MGLFKSKAEKEQERLERQQKLEKELNEAYEYIKNSPNAKIIRDALLKDFLDLNSDKCKKLRNGFTYDINVSYNGINIILTQRALLNIQKLMKIYNDETESIIFSDLGVDNIPSEYRGALDKYLFEELSAISYIKVYKGAFGYFIAPADDIKSKW